MKDAIISSSGPCCKEQLFFRSANAEAVAKACGLKSQSSERYPNRGLEAWWL
jgi:hypothetical protein